MRTFTSAALLAAALFGFNAFAGSGELDYPPAGAQGGSLTRSQVQHELAIARAAGQLVFGEAQEPAARPATPPPVRRSRPNWPRRAMRRPRPSTSKPAHNPAIAARRPSLARSPS